MRAYALVGMTAVVGALSAVIVFALLRFIAAARDARQKHHATSGEVAVLSAALEEALAKLKRTESDAACAVDSPNDINDEILASLTAGLLVVGTHGEVKILNPAGRRMLNVADGAGQGDYRRAVNVPALSKLIDECLAERTAIVRRTLTLPETAEGPSHIGVTVSPLTDANGTLHGAVCLFTDLTAVKALEEQLRLKESLATVGELTAGIAHEFRNGLATILGYSKLFDLGNLPDSYQAYVKGIRSEAESLGQIVTNFLNFARPAELTLSSVDLRAICDRAAEEIRGDVGLIGGELSITGDFSTIEGDDVLLRQAFSNLLRNALEACVGASRTPRIHIHAEIDRVQQVSRITVADNGPGIEPSARHRVFQPFVTSKRTGTGLGLALVQKIIVFHNGRVGVGESELGGAALTVTIPLRASAA